MGQQLTTPLFVQKGQATRLHRVPFCDSFKSEDWLQDLLFRHPQLIPVDEIEPVFGDLLPVARELPTESGSLDLLYVNAKGYLTLVETKLWRNPEARRSVVAQIIDYAKDLSQWSYDDLIAAVREAAPTKAGDPLVELARAADDDFDERRFIDTLTRNLRAGRFLLLIVGDGIQEGVEHMADFLQQTPRLGFTLGLVEVGLYRMHPDKNDPLLVQPRVLARTREVTRAVVEVRVPVGPGDVSVTLPPEPSEGGGRGRITEDEFYRQLDEQTGPRVVTFARWAIAEAPRHGLDVEWKSAGPSFRYRHRNSTRRFSLGYLNRDGSCGFGWLADQCESADIPTRVATDYFAEVANLIPGASAEPEGVAFDADLARRSPDVAADAEAVETVSYQWGAPPMLLLAPRKEQWFAAVDRVVERIRKALDGK